MGKALKAESTAWSPVRQALEKRLVYIKVGEQG